MSCEVGIDPKLHTIEGLFRKGSPNIFKAWCFQQISCYLQRIKKHKFIFLKSFFNSSNSYKKCQRLAWVNKYTGNL